MSTDPPFSNADPSWYRKVLDTLARDYPEISAEVWGKTISANAEEQQQRAAKILPEPLPCAREGCGKTAAAHLGLLLGHQYQEPEPDRRQLEHASGTPRMVDGPGSTPAALAGRQAADRARNSVLQPWERDLVAMDEAGQIPEVGADEFERARENGRAFCARLGTPRVMQFAADGQLQPVEPDPLAAVRPAEVQPAPPADATAGPCTICHRNAEDPAHGPDGDGHPYQARATADEKCHRCGRPFDPADTHFEGHGRHRDSPFCNSCVSACHDTEIADHWCAVDAWNTAPGSIRP